MLCSVLELIFGKMIPSSVFPEFPIQQYFPLHLLSGSFYLSTEKSYYWTTTIKWKFCSCLLLNFTCFSMVFLLFLRSWTWIPMFAKFVRDPLLSESLTTLNFPWFEGILAVFINWLVMTRETDQEASDQKLKITFIWALRDFVYKLSLWGREGYKLTKFLTLFHETRENTKLQFIRFSWLNLMIFKFFSIIQI